MSIGSLPFLSLLESFFQFLQIIFPRRREDIDPLDHSLGCGSVLHVRRVNADVTGLHEELLVPADVFFLTFQKDLNLLCRMAMEGVFETRRVLEETYKHSLPSNHTSLCLP